jgi:hypothetical protein
MAIGMTGGLNLSSVSLIYQVPIFLAERTGSVLNYHSISAGLGLQPEKIALACSLVV